MLVILLVVGLVAWAPSPAAVAAGSSGLEIGYGPGALFQSGSGTPVYTSGDELWLMSQSNATAQLGQVSGNLTVDVQLVAGVPTRAHVFGPNDTQGIWILQLLGTSYQPVIFYVSDAAQAGAGLARSGWSLGAGGLSMNFSLSAGFAFYDGTACVAGGYDQGTAVVSVPASDGGGTLNITKAGDTLNIIGGSLGNTSLAVSAELYYPYSFLAPNSTTTFISREVMVQASDAVGISKGLSYGVVALHSEAVVRPGEYQLRVFFDGPSGLSVTATDVVLTSEGAWIWLGACQETQVFADNFRLLSPLGPDPRTWPREVILDYKVFGVEAYAIAPVGLNLSAVAFVGAPYGVPLTGYRVAVLQSSGVEGATASGGSEFVVLSGGGGSLDYSLEMGNQTMFTGSAGTLVPFSVTTVTLNVSRLQVEFSVGGAPFPGGSVKVGNKHGALVTQTTGAQGTASFYLPGGLYNVTASGGGQTAQGTVTLVAGQSATLSLGGQSQLYDLGTVEILLVAAALVGLVLNGILYSSRRKKRKVSWKAASVAGRESGFGGDGALAEIVELGTGVPARGGLDHPH